MSTRSDEQYQRLADKLSSSPRNLSGVVLECLGREIIGGQVASNQILPREDELARRFKVSRTVVRDAIRMLAAKGLVETRTKRGTSVRPRMSWQLFDDDVLRWMLAECGDHEFLRDLIELRQVVEPAAAQMAAARATPEDLEQIEQACRMMGHHIHDERSFLEADIAFHMAVLGGTHNEAMIQLSQAIKVALLVAFQQSMESPDAANIAFPLHQAVFESIRAHNPIDAGNAMMVCVRQDEISFKQGTAVTI